MVEYFDKYFIPCTRGEETLWLVANNFFVCFADKTFIETSTFQQFFLSLLFWQMNRNMRFKLFPQRFTHPLWNVFKKTTVAYGADLLASELNGEVVWGLPGHYSLENLVLSWVRRVVGDDCLEILLMFLRQHVRSLAFSLALPSWKIRRMLHFVLFFVEVNPSKAVRLSCTLDSL